MGSRRFKQVPKREANIACERCQRRHEKCDGEPNKSCSQCTERGWDCKYRRTGDMKVVLAEEYKKLQDDNKLLNEELERMKITFGDLNSGGIRSKKGNSNTHATKVDSKEDRPILKVKPSVSQTGEFCGVSMIHQLGPIMPGGEFAHQDADDESAWRNPPSPVFTELPPVGVARHLYRSQHEYIGTIFAFVQRSQFEARLELFSKSPPDPMNRESCLAYCQVLLVLAFGELYELNCWVRDGPPGLHYFRTALKYLPGAHEPASVLFVEVLGLTGYFLQVLNRRSAAFLYIGWALRMAISLGLHQELDSELQISAVDREHRRRVWWSVYSMDRVISVKWGNPITIHDGDIGVNWPSFQKDLDDNPSPARVLECYSKMSTILGRIGAEIYGRKNYSHSELMVTIQSITNDLSDWYRALAPELRINLTNLGANLTREAISTYLHFYQCVNMTARPLLYSVTQKRLRALQDGMENTDWKTVVSESIVTHIKNSIVAAQKCTHIINAALKQGKFAIYGFMDGEHAFSSAVTLVMANVALEKDEETFASMETAMQILQSMADRGNRHIGHRLAHLKSLRSTMPSNTENFHVFPVTHEPGDSHEETPGDWTTSAFAEGQDPFFAPFPYVDMPVQEDMNFTLNDVVALGFRDEQGWIADTQNLCQHTI